MSDIILGLRVQCYFKLTCPMLFQVDLSGVILGLRVRCYFKLTCPMIF